MGIAAVSGYYLERIAYRPLRGAPPGAADLRHRRIDFPGKCRSTAVRRATPRLCQPGVLARGTGWNIPVGRGSVVLTYTGVLTFVLSVLIMIGLYLV